MAIVEIDRLIPAHTPLKTAKIEFNILSLNSAIYFFTDVCPLATRDVLKTVRNKNLITLT